MITLRGYQQELKQAVYAAWGDGQKNVIIELPTGGGKTATSASIIHDMVEAMVLYLRQHSGPACVIAHRQELVGQLSQALAREGIRHNLVAPKKVRDMIIRKHVKEFGYSYFDPSARCHVAGVDTLIRLPENTPWFRNITLWMIDEAHHVLKANKWGKAVSLFTHPDCLGLGVSATIERADGKGLGRGTDGWFDIIVRGPNMRWLINNGYLSEYRIIVPPSTFDRLALGASAGEFKKEDVKKETKRTIIGDVVKHYQQFAAGKLGITFADCVENAELICASFNEAGIPAVVLTGDTDDAIRESSLEKFANREIMQIINVALLDEGFDCPAVEVVSDAAATMSRGRFIQRFGRMLRILFGKTHGIYIDHVNNVGDGVTYGHGLPDRVRLTTLNRREKRRSAAPDDAIPLTRCLNMTCRQPYERHLTACPHCGEKPLILDRSSPVMVDGNLMELSPEVLARMRGEADAVMGSHVPVPYGRPELKRVLTARHVARQHAQDTLRAVMAGYGGLPRHRSIPEAQKLFFLMFGTDMLTAQTLGETDALALAERIRLWVLIEGYTIPGYDYPLTAPTQELNHV